jgi:hypothetical protein
MFKEMLNDGWFPFVQMLGGEFEQLSVFYKDKCKFADSINKLLDNFNEDRIRAFTGNWWRNSIFGDKEKQPIIESGIGSYLTGNYIACIKTLYSEIEGIIRISYVNEKGKDPKFKELNQYVCDKANDKFSSINSLGFPDIFFKYLGDIFFKNFDLNTGNVDLSRHTTSHGVAKAEDYTRTKALQGILILDQIYRYL